MRETSQPAAHSLRWLCQKSAHTLPSSPPFCPSTHPFLPLLFLRALLSSSFGPQGGFWVEITTPPPLYKGTIKGSAEGFMVRGAAAFCHFWVHNCLK